MGEKKGESVARLSPSLCVFSWRSLWGCVCWVLRAVAYRLCWVSSGEAGKVGKVPWFTPLQTCVSGRALASRSEHVFMTLQRCVLCYRSWACRSCVQEEQAVILVLAHETVSAQAFVHLVHLPKSLWGLQQTKNWLSGSFAAFSGCPLPEAPGDLVCYLARRGEKTA